MSSIHFTLGRSGKLSKQAALWRRLLELMVNAQAYWCDSTDSKSKKPDKILMQIWNVILLNLISFSCWVAPAERFLYVCYLDPTPEPRVPWGEVAWVWLVLPPAAAAGSMLPLELWCQASPQELLWRSHLVQTVLCSGWSDRIASWVLGPWRCRWGICMEWELARKSSTTGSCPAVTVPIDLKGNPDWLPTTAVSTWSGWAQRWQNLTVAHRKHVIFGDRVQIPTLPGRWQA